jgi:hypothetical protein
MGSLITLTAELRETQLNDLAQKIADIVVAK